MLSADKLRQSVLERLDLGAEDILAASQNPDDSALHIFLDSRILGAQINELGHFILWFSGGEAPAHAGAGKNAPPSNIENAQRKRALN